MLKYDNTVSSQVDGKPIYGAQVSVYTADDSTPALATIFADEAGTTPLSQPILTDQMGYFAFYIGDGKYNIRVMTGAVEISRTNITMVDTLQLKQRALIVPVNEDGGTLPPADQRQGKLLGFDSGGNPTMAVPNSFSGPPGTANNTYSSYSELIASDPTRQYAYLSGDTDPNPRPDGPYTNPTRQQGAWIAQPAEGVALTLGAGAPTRNVQASVTARAINMRDEGAALDGVTDDSAAFVRALARSHEVVIPGRMYINTTVSLPDRVQLTGWGSQRSAIVLGPNGYLKMEGPGYANPADPATLQPFGRAVFSKLGFATADAVATVALPNLLFWKVQHISFVDCLFYHAWLNLDNHRYISFLKCEFYTGRGSGLLSQCSFQPTGGQFINECMVVDACHHSGGGWELRDTVEPRFDKSTFFGGPYGIRSYRQNATGTAQTPFYMGPIITACTFDAIAGFGVDVDGGGTNCRLIGCFFSAGRVVGQSVAAPGARFTNSQGVEVVGNHFEWCGLHGIVLANCANFTLVANTFLNLASGSGLYITQSGGFVITANMFENRELWGGSGSGNMQLAIETPASDLTSSYVAGNRVAGMKNALGMYVEGGGNRVFANPGAPINTERNWAPAKSGGWTASTGTALRGAYATYGGGSSSYGTTQDNALRDVSQRVKALEDALRVNQIIDG